MGAIHLSEPVWISERCRKLISVGSVKCGPFSTQTQTNEISLLLGLCEFPRFRDFDSRLRDLRMSGISALRYFGVFGILGFREFVISGFRDVGTLAGQ